MSCILVQTDVNLRCGLSALTPGLVVLNQGCSWKLDAFQAWRGKGGAGFANLSVLNI